MSIEYIPKIVHYAWFGRGDKSEEAKACIASWKKYLTGYKFIEWNEDNFDLNKYRYTKEAYESKSYAFVTDVVRLHVLYEFGGIYMDTDVEVIKPLDPLLVNHAFSGFESDDSIPTGIIASEKNNQWVKDQLEYYDTIGFLDNKGKEIYVTNVETITNISKEKHGFIQNGQYQILKYNMVMYPKDFFCPKSLETGEVNITNNTYTIHHFAGSWVPEKAKINRWIYRKLRKILSENTMNMIMKNSKKRGKE